MSHRHEIRLAELLGFDGLVENAYDANHLAPIDSALDVANAYAMTAVQTGMFAQDLHTQYAEPTPWFMLGSGELTGLGDLLMNAVQRTLHLSCFAGAVKNLKIEFSTLSADDTARGAAILMRNKLIQ